MSVVEVLACPYCGSKVRWEGEAVLTCPYCGTVFTRQGSVGEHLMEPVNYDPGAVFRLFVQWALRMPETPNDFAESAALRSCRLEFHPYWLYEVVGSFAYSAVASAQLLPAEPLLGLAVESFLPEGFSEAGSEEEVIEVSVPGLRQDSRGVLGRLRLSLAGKIHFSHDYVRRRGGVLLNPDVPPEEADRLAVSEAERRVSERLGRRLGGSVSARLVSVKNMERRLVHVPIYVCEYTYGGRSYSLLAEASSARVLHAVIPKEARFRAAAALAGGAALAVAALTLLLALPRAPLFALVSSAGLTLSGSYSLYRAAGRAARVTQYFAE